MTVGLLSLIALILAVYGLVQLVKGRLMVGVGAILAAVLVGPAGISIFGGSEITLGF